MTDLKLFGKLSHFKFPLREREREKERPCGSFIQKRIFFHCPEINSLFSFLRNAKKIIVFLMLLAFSFKFRYFNLPFSFKFCFVFLFGLTSVVDAGICWVVQGRPGRCAGCWVSSGVCRCLLRKRRPWGDVDRGQETQRVIFWVVASCRCYYHFQVEEQTKRSPRWNKLHEARQRERRRTEIYWEKISEPVNKRNRIYSGENKGKTYL